jgi:hypothetical protein
MPPQFGIPAVSSVSNRFSLTQFDKIYNLGTVSKFGDTKMPKN